MDCVLEVSHALRKRLQASVLLALMLLVSLATPASAAAISQGYQATTTLAPDTLVSQDNTPNQVVPADLAHAAQLLGVVVAPTATAAAVATTGDDVQVVTGGMAVVFVADLNGPVKAGDMITVSPIQGVGMKAVAAGKIIGVAQASAATTASKTVSVPTSGGKSTTAHITTVPVMVQTSYYTPVLVTPKGTTPHFLQLFANQVAGRPVAVLRVTVSTVILVVALCIVCVMLFSVVRGTMTALGRNPLARRSIYQGLWQVLATIIIIMVIGLVGAYVVLTR